MRRQPGESSTREIGRITEIALRPSGATIISLRPTISPGLIGSTDPTTGIWSPSSFYPATFPIHLNVKPTVPGTFPIKLNVVP